MSTAQLGSEPFDHPFTAPIRGAADLVPDIATAQLSA